MTNLDKLGYTNEHCCEYHGSKEKEARYSGRTLCYDVSHAVPYSDSL